MSVTSAGYVNVSALSIPQTDGYRLKKCGTLITPEGNELLADEYTIQLSDGTELRIDRERLLICVFKLVKIDIKLWNEISYHDKRYMKKGARFVNNGKVTCSKDVRHYMFTDMGRKTDLEIEGKVYRLLPASHLYCMTEDGITREVATLKILEPIVGRLGYEEYSMMSAITGAHGRILTALAHQQTWGEWSWRNNYEALDDMPLNSKNYKVVCYDGPIGCHRGTVTYNFAGRDYFTGEEFYVSKDKMASFGAELNRVTGLKNFALNTRANHVRLVGNCFVANLARGDKYPELTEMVITPDHIRKLGYREAIDIYGNVAISAKSNVLFDGRFGCAAKPVDTILGELGLTRRYRLGNLTLNENNEIVTLGGIYNKAFIWRQQPIKCRNIFTNTEVTYADIIEAIEKSGDSRENIEAVLSARSTIISPNGNIFHYVHELNKGIYTDNPYVSELIFAGKGHLYRLYFTGKMASLGSVKENQRVMDGNNREYYRSVMLSEKSHITLVRFTREWWTVVGENKLIHVSELKRRYRIDLSLERLEKALVA